MANRTFQLAALDHLFAPRSVALIGASTTPGKWGLFVLHNLLKDGYAGRVHAVGRKGATAFGQTFVGSLDEIDGDIDLALVCVPPRGVMEAVEGALRRGVKAIYVITGGFSETGTAEGRAAEERLVELSRHSGVPIVGPNGQGITNAQQHLCAQMFFTMPPQGQISLVTQSGNLGVVFAALAVCSGIGMSKIVSTGNAACADLADFVEYFGADPETGVVLVYAEGTNQGRELLDAIRSASVHKPVLLMKAGNSPAGTKAATSHSAAMASDSRLFIDACRNAGAMVVRSAVEMWDAACALSSQPLMRGPRVGILTLGGGLGVVSADLVAEAGLEVTPLAPSLLGKLDELMPARWSRGNPVDTAAADSPTAARDGLRLLCEQGDYDAILYVGFGMNDIGRHWLETGPFASAAPIPELVPAMRKKDADIGVLVRELMAERQLPILCVGETAYLAHSIRDSVVLEHARHGQHTFPTPERAVCALRHLYDYSLRKNDEAARLLGKERS